MEDSSFENTSPEDKQKKETEPESTPPSMGNAQRAALLIFERLMGDKYDKKTVKPVGEGGNGVVIQIRETRLGRDVAMKSLQEAKIGSDIANTRMFLEAAITGNLGHPSIVAVHDVGFTVDDEDQSKGVFFTMELVKGISLERLLFLIKRAAKQEDQEHKPIEAPIFERYLGIPARLELFQKICDAVEYAHQHPLKVIHRDIKPANVMVGQYGEVLLMDWGIATLLGKGDLADELRLIIRDVAHSQAISHHTDRPSIPKMTNDGAFIGTYEYASPEQLENSASAQIGPHSDIYCLGGLLYTLLALDEPVHYSAEQILLLSEHEDLLRGYQLKSEAGESFTEEEAHAFAEAHAAYHKAKRAAVQGLIKAGKTAPKLRDITSDQSVHRIPEALRPLILAALEPNPEMRPKSVTALRQAVEKYLTGFANDFEKAGPWKQFCYYYQRNKQFCKTVAAALVVLLLVSIGFILKIEKEKNVARYAEGVARAAGLQAEADKIAAQNAQAGEKAAKVDAIQKAADAEDSAWAMIELAVPYIRKYGRGQQILDQLDARFGGNANKKEQLSQLDHAKRGIAYLMRAEHELRYGRQENVGLSLKPALEHLWLWNQGSNHRELAVEPLRYAFGILGTLPTLQNYKDWGQGDWTARGEKFTMELQPREARTAWGRASKDAAKARIFSGEQLAAAEQMMAAISELQTNEIDEGAQFELWDMMAWHCAAHIRYSDEVAAKLYNQGKFNENSQTVIESAIRRHKAIVKEIADFIRREPMRREPAVSLLYVCSPVVDALRDISHYDEAQEILLETQVLMSRVVDADPNNLQLKERFGEAMNMEVTLLDKQLESTDRTPTESADLLQRLATLSNDQVKIYESVCKADDSRYGSELLLAKARSYRVYAIASLIEAGMINKLMPLPDAESEIQHLLDLSWQGLSNSPINDSSRSGGKAIAAGQFVKSSNLSNIVLSQHNRLRHLERAEQACAWAQANNEPWHLAEIAERWLQYKEEEPGSYYIPGNFIWKNSPDDMPGFLARWRNDQKEWSKNLAREREIAMRCSERALTVRLKLMSYTDFENLEPHFLQIVRELEIFAQLHFKGNPDAKDPSKQIFVRSYLDSANLLNELVRQDNIVYRNNEMWIKSLADFTSRMPMLWLRNSTVVPELRGAASGVANIGANLRGRLRTAAPTNAQRAIEAAKALQVSWRIDLLCESKIVSFDDLGEPLVFYPSASTWNKLKRRGDEILHELNSASLLDSEKLLEKEIAVIRTEVLVDVIRIEAEAGDKTVAEQVYQSALKELKRWPELVQQIKSLPSLFKKK